MWNSLQMQCIGHLSALGNSQVPAVYRQDVLFTLSAPRTGVDLLLATSTHLLEIFQGLVLRSCPFPTTINRVVRLRRVDGLREGWSYLVQGENSLVFVDGLRFALRERQYHGVDGVEVDDFLETGEQLVCICMSWGEGKVLTDGIEEIDLGASWPLVEDENSVQDILEKRLKEVRRAVAVSRQKSEIAEKRKQETLAVLSKKLGSVETSRDVLAIIEYWWRVNSDSLVIGIPLEAAEKVEEVGLLLVDPQKDICYSTSLVIFKAKGGVLRPFEVSNFGCEAQEAKATLIAHLNLGQVMSSLRSTYSLLASITYKNNKKEFCQSTPQPLVLDMQRLRCPRSPLLLSFLQPDSALQSLLTLFATRARVALRVSTERGSLQPLAPILDRVGLELAPSLGGFFTSPAHTLHPAGVIPWPECANQASLLLLTHTHSHLTMLASLLRSVLPADSTFQLETK